MKKITTLFMALTFVLSLCACTAFKPEDPAADTSHAPTWQEQYDLGIRYLSEGNYEEAILAFTAAIEIDPKRAPAYVGRGNAYIGAGETEANLSAGKADYEKAIELDETSAEAYLGLADVYIAQGDIEKALEILERGLNNAGNAIISEKINELRGEVETVQKQFEELLRAGKTNNMLSFEEITFLGEPLHKFTIDEIISKMKSMGMDIYENNEDDYRCAIADFERLSFGPSVSALQKKNETYVSLLGYDSGVVEEDAVAIGIRDLMTGSTMESLFNALGFSNGKEISGFIHDLMEREYGSFEEASETFQKLQYSDETLHIYFSSIGGSETGEFSIGELTFSLFLRNANNNDGYYDFSFRYTGNPVFEDRLTDYSIDIID